MKYPKIKTILFSFLALWLSAAQASSTQERIDQDITHGKPVIVHVSVALADNKNQWIVPVPESIGNGQDPKNNLYWGARYGLKTFLRKDAGWKLLSSNKPKNSSILERIVLSKKLTRKGQPTQVYLVADAWDGRFISDTIKQFLKYSGGHDALLIKTNNTLEIRAGGAAHLNVYIGHNALMDYFGVKDKFISTPDKAANSIQSDSIVLACKSKSYFESRLDNIGSHSLVLTTGLMAPEAYSLDAAITAWIKGGSDRDIRKAAAAAYAKYQKIRRRSAEALFGVDM